MDGFQSLLFWKSVDKLDLKKISKQYYWVSILVVLEIG